MNKICRVSGCENKVKQNGYCSKHYTQIYRHGRLTPELERFRYSEYDTCNAVGCKKPPNKRGYCEAHYQQILKTGKVKKIIEKKNEVIYHDTYAELILTDKNGDIKETTLVDLECLNEILKYKWYFNGRYVASGKLGASLHRFIMGSEKGTIVDHINHNTKDNRKNNLRICNVSLNTAHHKLYKTNTSGKTGVTYENGKWRARIKKDGKLISLGMFQNKDDAIKIRIKTETKLWGEYSPVE